MFLSLSSVLLGFKQVILFAFQIGLCKDFDRIFPEMLEKKICVGHSLLYVWYATFLESKGKLYDAQMVYQMGILRSISSLMPCWFFFFSISIV